MNIENESVEKLKKNILEILGKYLDISKYRVFFFGSRVLGHNDESSDIDVGIEGAEPIPLAVMSNIEEEIEEMPTLYKIEIVDFCRVPKKFKEVAEQTIELIAQ